MPNSDLLPSLLYKINENQQALEAAIMELTLWVEQRGSGEVGGAGHDQNKGRVHQHDARRIDGAGVINPIRRKKPIGHVTDPIDLLGDGECDQLERLLIALRAC